MPRYSALIPPSVLYMAPMVCHMPGSLVGFAPSSANDADWIERRVRTMSSGYVKVTDVMPAIPPQNRRATGVRLSPGWRSKNCYGRRVSVLSITKRTFLKPEGWLRTLL
jgi:hypothetical protein